MKFLTLFLTPFIALAAMADETPDGTIPSKHLGVMDAYVGSYTGKFDGRRGTLTLTMDGQRPTLSFTAEDGSADMVGSDCASEIGQLTNVDFDQKKSGVELDDATFAFTPGNCISIRGRTVNLDFRHKNGAPYKVNASIYHETEWVWEPNPPHCDPMGSCWGGGGSQRPVDYYLTGSFNRQ